MSVYLQAGFEAFRVPWQGDRCLLTADRHLPEDRMAQHYATLRALGIRSVRDALPWWLPIAPRLRVAREARMAVTFDLWHYGPIPDPEGYARRVAEATRAEWSGPLWVCFNETAMAPQFTPGLRYEDGIALARTILAALRAELPDVRLVTAEPCHHRHELHAHAWAAADAEVIGLNIYPHWLGWRIEDALRAAAARYPGKRIAITETGAHRGHPDVPQWMGKGDWLAHVLDAVARSGVPVESVCLYPAVCGTSWHGAGTEVWDNGLIRRDGSVDEELAAVVRRATGQGMRGAAG